MRFKQVELHVSNIQGILVTSKLKDSGFSNIGRQSKKRMPFFGKSELLAMATEL
jgi:hypothetical protein